VGRGLEVFTEWGWGQDGRDECSCSWRIRGQRLTTPLSTCPRPDGDAATLEAHPGETGPETLKLSVGLLRHPPKKVGRRCWYPRRRAPILPLPPRSAVTQPSPALLDC
jgi:hypothetical protein